MNDELIVTLQTPPLPYYWEAGRADYRAGDRHPNRKQLGLFDLLIVINGALHIGENGKEWSLGAGDTLLLLPDGKHYAVKPCEQETSFYWLHFEHALWRQSPPIAQPAAVVPSSPFDSPKLISIPKQSVLPSSQAAFDLMRQLLELPIGEAFWEKQHLLFQLLALLEHGSPGRTSTPAARLAEKAAAYLQRNYREEITNETLASALHFHPNYIVRCMKMRYGATPIHYLLQFRMERAKQLLISTDWSIDRIAEEVGFRYSPYFTTCFKRSVGMTPLHFRKQYVH